MKRFRLVTEQTNGWATSRHVSSVILSEEEAYQSLKTEMEMHEAASWIVEKSILDLVEGRIVCKRGNNTRIITIESFDPMNDHLSTE